MPNRNPSALPPYLLIAALAATHGPLLAADEILIEDDIGGQSEIVIDAGGSDQIMIDAGGNDEIMIDGGGSELIIDNADAATDDATVIDDAAPASVTGAGSDSHSRLDIGLDEARLELGGFTRSRSASDRSVYGKLAASANWQPDPRWEFQAAARIDGYDEDGRDSFSDVRADYGDTYVSYRGDNIKLTLGSQTVIWGRLDELPLSDRVSTADLGRVVLDDLEDRRRSNPMLRAETFVAGGKLDLVWLVDFREAEMPDKDSVWYPIDRREGRVLGLDPDDVAPAFVRAAAIDEDEPHGDGGFGARFTRNHSFADIGMTLARTRQSIPYFRADGNTLRAEYPRSWAVGLDAATNRAGAIWRAEAVYSSDNPVTRRDLSYTTVPALQWGLGVEMHPGDGDSRVNLQLIGNNLIDAPKILDRSEIYSFNGEIEIPFDRERWRASLDFNLGLGDKDVYLNPEITFLGFEPHELYLAAHYFDGSSKTLGGFYKDRSLINVGWRAKF